VSIHDVLEGEAADLRPGESGLLALDWWNGNRSVLVDADLRGLIVGMTLATSPPEIYRALLEATAFGTRVVIETLERSGVSVDAIVACGGLPDRNPLLMQIFSDVTGRVIELAGSLQVPALGAAMFGAVAAGSGGGGYDSIVEASRRMAHLSSESYKPRDDFLELYDRLYSEYLRLHDLFGRGGEDVMRRLKSLQFEAAARTPAQA
jgi:L-ribulokinase